MVRLGITADFVITSGLHHAGHLRDFPAGQLPALLLPPAQRGLDRAADSLIEAGVQIAIGKQGPGPKGALAKTRGERIVAGAIAAFRLECSTTMPSADEVEAVLAAMPGAELK